MPKTVPLYNLHFFQSLIQEMHRTNKYMIIDGSGTLWHIDDLTEVILQYQPKEAINK